MASESALGTPIPLTVPLGATTVTIQHESYTVPPPVWEQNNPNTIFPGTVNLDYSNAPCIYSVAFNWEPTSAGTYTVLWYDANSNLVQRNYWSIYQQYVSSSDFFTDYPQYVSGSASFATKERKIRRLISSYCQQSFEPWINRCITVNGKGDNILTFDRQMLVFNSVIDHFGYDLTVFCELDTDSPNYLSANKADYPYYEQKSDGLFYDVDIKSDYTYHSKNTFKRGVDYYVTGDFGWYTVPDDVIEATKLLIVDEYTGVNDMRNHGVQSSQLGDFHYQLGELDQSTGNIQADQLLSSYNNDINIRLI